MPLVFTLADMENEGIIACREALTEYGDKLAVRIAELEKQIYEEAGEEFNINSPKQLGVILFEKIVHAVWKENKDRLFHGGGCVRPPCTGISDRF